MSDVADESKVRSVTDGADWQLVDRTLQSLARQRAALDAEEARWLREAERIQIWRRVGCSSLLEYMERRLGYGPRAAQDRLRVAFALDKLPALAESLETGALPFTAIRELTRVATPETEQVWVDAGRDKNVHEIEKLVAGHRHGDLPGDPPDPQLIKKVLRYEVRPATYALMRQAQRALEKERGERLDDDQLLAALATAVLGAATGTGSSATTATTASEAKPPASDATPPDSVEAGGGTSLAEPATAGSVERGGETGLVEQPRDREDHGTADHGRARFQVAVVVCAQCKRGWLDGGGATAPMDAAALARASCDAQRLGRVDVGQPARATQDVAPRVRRLVHRRDRGRCGLPECRAAANLEVHHIVAREDGGSHDARNLMLLCSLCRARHKGHYAGCVVMPGSGDPPTTMKAFCPA